MILTADELAEIRWRLEWATKVYRDIVLPDALRDLVTKDVPRLLAAVESAPREPKDHPKFQRMALARDHALAKVKRAEAERDELAVYAERREYEACVARMALEDLTRGPLDESDDNHDAREIVHEALDALRDEHPEGEHLRPAVVRVLVAQEFAKPGEVIWRASIFTRDVEHCGHGATPDAAIAALVAPLDERARERAQGGAS